MGRTLKRVPMDFDWPLGEVWKGYINEQRRPCPEHGKTCFYGVTGASRWLESILHLLNMAGEESRGISSTEDFDYAKFEHQKRGRTYPHPYLTNLETAPTFTFGNKWNGEEAKRGEAPLYYRVPITKDLADLLERFSGEEFDASSLYNDDVLRGLRRRLLKIAKLPKDWGVCPVCKGNRVDPAALEAYEAWTRTDPPAGDGYQLWETTTEGSPVSPVFATLDELCAWCEGNATVFGDQKTTAKKWREMLDEDYVRHEESGMEFS